MAEDLDRTFGLAGRHDYISAIGAYGVALASTQALKAASDEKAAQKESLKDHLATPGQHDNSELRRLDLALIGLSFTLGTGSASAA